MAMVALVAVIFLLWGQSTSAETDRFQSLSRNISNKDAFVIAGPDGTIVASKYADRPRIPASTLKILTSLMALETLGPDFRFKTEFYLDPHGNLKIKGYGDPLLISEVLDDIGRQLQSGIQSYQDLILDDSWFAAGTIPGVTASANPYDAPNGALCVNFNTVNFKRVNGIYVSAEPQTPLLDMALPRIRRSGRSSGRIIFSAENDEALTYAGHMFRYFLAQHGIVSHGKVVLHGKVDKTRDRLIHRYVSRFPLTAVISKLLTFSNNFTANQIFLTMGAQQYGPPATMAKSLSVANQFIHHRLQRSDIVMVEGSGISRDNRLTANALLDVLNRFIVHRDLMPRKGPTWYKSGTLHGISTRAGYIQGNKADVFRFVVLFNSKGNSAEQFVNKLVGKIMKQ